jgi:hypothetical protein
LVAFGFASSQGIVVVMGHRPPSFMVMKSRVPKVSLVPERMLL